jgi:hypothetical protein
MERDKIKKALTSRMNFYRFRETLLSSDSKLLGGLMSEQEEFAHTGQTKKNAELEKTVEREFSSNPTNLSR